MYGEPHFLAVPRTVSQDAWLGHELDLKHELANIQSGSLPAKHALRCKKYILSSKAVLPGAELDLFMYPGKPSPVQVQKGSESPSRSIDWTARAEM